jgi:hypothetical protein
LSEQALGRPKGRPVYIVGGARKPFIKARGKPGPFTPVDLAVQCGRHGGDIAASADWLTQKVDQNKLGRKVGGGLYVPSGIDTT